MNMDERDSWQALQRADEEERYQRALAALKVAESYGVPQEQIQILASEAGVQYPTKPERT